MPTRSRYVNLSLLYLRMFSSKKDTPSVIFPFVIGNIGYANLFVDREWRVYKSDRVRVWRDGENKQDTQRPRKRNEISTICISIPAVILTCNNSRTCWIRMLKKWLRNRDATRYDVLENQVQRSHSDFTWSSLKRTDFLTSLNSALCAQPPCPSTPSAQRQTSSKAFVTSAPNGDDATPWPSPRTEVGSQRQLPGSNPDPIWCTVARSR